MHFSAESNFLLHLLTLEFTHGIAVHVAADISPAELLSTGPVANLHLETILSCVIGLGGLPAGEGGVVRGVVAARDLLLR